MSVQNGTVKGGFSHTLRADIDYGVAKPKQPLASRDKCSYLKVKCFHVNNYTFAEQDKFQC